MNAENARQCLTDIGCSPDRINHLAELVEAGKLSEAKQRLRCLRCDLMEELHLCQRRVDQLDWLIRETERANTARQGGCLPVRRMDVRGQQLHH